MALWRRRRTWIQDGQQWISVLARYNSEISRGIVHTDEWKASMAKLQQRFDEATANDPPWAWRWRI